MTRIQKIFRKIGRRRKGSHKGSFGHVLVLAGSASYTGAPYLTSQAALLSGSGLVTLGVPAGIHPILAKKVVEVMARPFPETDESSLSLKAEREITDFSEKVDVVAIGPGLSLNPQTQRLVRSLIAKIKKPFVIDADGIAALAGHGGMLKKLKHPIVLTPHPGEFSRLTGRSVAAIQESRKKVAISFAKEYNVVLVLKGHGTVIAAPDGETYVNKTGNPGMASGGTGDVLTGMIASFIGQGLGPFEASILGVHVHGLAGDIAAKEKGELSLRATDLLHKIPDALKKLT